MRSSASQVNVERILGYLLTPDTTAYYFDMAGAQDVTRTAKTWQTEHSIITWAPRAMCKGMVPMAVVFHKTICTAEM